MKSIIIDASVALKWFFENEDDQDKANILLQNIRDGKLQLVVPDIWWYEITNVFRSSIKSGKMSLKNVKMHLKDLRELNLVTVDFISIMDLTCQIAVKLDISVYDASYVVLAKSQKYPFYTADKKLLDKIPSSYKWVKNIKNSMNL